MKQVIIQNTESETILISNASKSKIYGTVFNGEIFKLHEVKGVYLFCNIDDSHCGVGGYQNSMEDAISNVITGSTGSQIKVFQFDNQIEFLEWALQQAKSC